MKARSACWLRFNETSRCARPSTQPTSSSPRELWSTSFDRRNVGGTPVQESRQYPRRTKPQMKGHAMTDPVEAALRAVEEKHLPAVMEGKSLMPMYPAS